MACSLAIVVISYRFNFLAEWVSDSWDHIGLPIYVIHNSKTPDQVNAFRPRCLIAGSVAMNDMAKHDDMLDVITKLAAYEHMRKREPAMCEFVDDLSERYDALVMLDHDARVLDPSLLRRNIEAHVQRMSCGAKRALLCMGKQDTVINDKEAIAHNVIFGVSFTAPYFIIAVGRDINWHKKLCHAGIAFQSWHRVNCNCDIRGHVHYVVMDTGQMMCTQMLASNSELLVLYDLHGHCGEIHLFDHVSSLWEIDIGGAQYSASTRLREIIAKQRPFICDAHAAKLHGHHWWLCDALCTHATYVEVL